MINLFAVFASAVRFNQDISSWDVSGLLSEQVLLGRTGDMARTGGAGGMCMANDMDATSMDATSMSGTNARRMDATSMDATSMDATSTSGTNDMGGTSTRETYGSEFSALFVDFISTSIFVR